MEVRLDLGDGILSEGVNAFHLKVENISNRSVAVSGQVCVTAKAKTWSDTGEASNIWEVSVRWRRQARWNGEQASR